MQKIYKVLAKEWDEGTAKREPKLILDLQRIANGLFRTYKVSGAEAKKLNRTTKRGGEFTIEED